jgi:hypothetical protein
LWNTSSEPLDDLDLLARASDTSLEKGLPGAAQSDVPPSPTSRGPPPAAVAPDSTPGRALPEHLALDLATPDNNLEAGQWHPVRDLTDVLVSVISPATVRE